MNVKDKLVHQALLLGLTMISSLSLACDWSSDFETAKQLQAAGKGFLAANALEQATERCPEQARPYLELGQLWQQIGYTERAADVWRFALQHFELPENVALNIKLRILSANLAREKQWEHQLTLTEMPWYSSTDKLYFFSKAKWQSEYHFCALNIFGYTANTSNMTTLELNHALDTSVLDDTNSSSYSGRVSNQFSGTLGQLTTNIGLNANRANNQTEWTLASSIEANYATFSLAEYATWSPEESTLTLTTDLNYWLSNGSFIANYSAELEDNAWSTPTVGIARYWSGTLTPYLAFDMLDNWQTPQVTASIAQSLGKHWQLSLFGDVSSIEEELNWTVGSTITLRITMP
jgi:hypothetical protein